MKLSFLNPLTDRWNAKPEARDAVVEFFTEQFAMREPLVRCLRIEPAAFRPLSELIVDEAIRAKQCIVIESAEKTAIAAVLIYRDAATPPPHDLSAACPAAAPIHRLLDDLGRPFLERSPPKLGQTLDAMFMLVDARYEGQGLAWKLCLIGAPTILALGHVECVACLTNPRSQRLWQSLGGTIVNRIAVAPYFKNLGIDVGEDPGDVVFGYLNRASLFRALARYLARPFVRALGRRAPKSECPRAATAATSTASVPGERAL